MDVVVLVKCVVH